MQKSFVGLLMISSASSDLKPFHLPLPMRDKPLITEVKLRKAQDLIWQTLSQFNLAICHRSLGKTELVRIMVAFTVLLSPHPITVGVFAPSLKKARKLLFDKVRDYLESRQTQYIKFLKSEGRIINTRNNVTVDFFSLGTDGNATMARGERLTHVYLDEADECDGQEFFETLLPTQQGLPPDLEPHKRLVIIGTARGSATLFTQLISKYQPLSPDFSQINVDETDTEPLQIPPTLQQQLGSTLYRFYQFPVSRTNIISPDALQTDRLLMNKSQYQREYEVDLTAVSDETLFSVNDLYTASQSPPSGAPTEPSQDGHINEPDLSLTNTSPIVAGLDIAGSGDNLMVLSIRQGLNRPLFMHTIRTKDSNSLTRRNMEATISNIENLLNRYHCTDIACDASGLGDYFVQRMQERLSPYGFNIEAVKGQSTTPYHWEHSYVNTRSTLIGLAALAVKEHCPLPAIPTLMEELQAHIRDTEKQDSRLRVVGKDVIKEKLSGRSPDYSDSWFLTFFFEAQHPQDEFVATLRDIGSGRVTLTTKQYLEKFPEFYDQDNGSNQLWQDSMLNE